MTEANCEPLVSIGIPTFNRPNGLRKTLECITNQTYRNLEIIISDNFSDDPETELVIKEFMLTDSRVEYFKQEYNIGAMKNFKFVLKKAAGKYFMWASDDDLWKLDFIEKTTNFLEKNHEFIAVSMEAQYFSENDFDFFPEGQAFYNFYSTDQLERLKYILKYSYGNLIYGLYRRSILTNNKIIFDYNEIPFFLQIFRYGNWKVLPDIGFYKKTVLPTYTQAKWEIQGGVLSRAFNINLFKSFVYSLNYHKIAYNDILNSILTLSLTEIEKIHLKKDLRLNLIKHFFCLQLGYKKKVL